MHEMHEAVFAVQNETVASLRQLFVVSQPIYSDRRHKAGTSCGTTTGAVYANHKQPRNR